MIDLSRAKAHLAQHREVSTEQDRLRGKLAELRSKFAAAEAAATGGPAEALAIAAAAERLDTQRREIADLEYRIGLYAKSLASLREALERESKVIAAAVGVAFESLRLDVVAELRRRLAPFVTERTARTAVHESRIVLLADARRTAHGIAGHVDALKVAPAEACAAIVAKGERFTLLAAHVRREIGSK